MTGTRGCQSWPGFVAAAALVLTLNILLPHLLPGDPVTALIGEEASLHLTAADRSRLRAELGLDGTVWRQILADLVRLASLDLGISVSHGRPVADVLGAFLPWTLLLTLTALGIATAAGVLLGIGAAWWRGRRIERAMLAVMLSLGALPPFIIAMLLLTLFSSLLGWFPAGGGATPFTTARGPAFAADVVVHLVLPAAALALHGTAPLFLTARGTAVAILDKPFMEVARAKGLGPFRLCHRHLARNVLPPVAAGLGGALARMMTGALFVEAVFAYPGLGNLIVQAVQQRDYPMVQGVFLAVSAIVLPVNAVIDRLTARMVRRG